MFRNAQVISFNGTKCVTKDDILPVSVHSGRTYAIYMKQNYIGDYDTWINLARCFKIWDLDVRGFHKQTWRFWMYGNHIVTIGSLSPYFQFKPKHIKPMYLPKEKSKQ